ncbi:DNA-binding CsgD family transcriptional regulator [Amorphus suaedae]
MPGVRDYRDTATAGLLADSLMTIAESRSLEGLGEACRRAIVRLSGSPTVGLYLVADEPRLLYSYHTPRGFLDDYSRGMAKSDPIIDCIRSTGQVVDGASFFGPLSWSRSESYELLHSWGFGHNMCGPLRCEDAIVGVFYTANGDRDAPYSDRMKQQMALLCRASSIALTALARSGDLDDHPVVTDDRSAPRTYASGALPAVCRDTCLSMDLPPRSAQVARLLCMGQTNKTIAREMGISDQTVKEHVTNLCRRAGARNRTELAAMLLRTRTAQ